MGENEERKELSLYFVTVLDHKDEASQCVGYFKTFKEAERVVLENVCDIFEFTYTQAVIEKVPVGLYPLVEEEVWYEAVYGDYELENVYKLAEKPDWAKRYSGFAIC